MRHKPRWWTGFCAAFGMGGFFNLIVETATLDRQPVEWAWTVGVLACGYLIWLGLRE